MNKKKILGIICIVVVIISCSFLVAFTIPDNGVQYIKTNYVGASHGTTIVIETREELDQYIEENKEQHGLGHREKVYSDSTIGFEDAIADYDEKWFEDNNLVLVLLTASSGNYRYKVTNNFIKDGIMNVSITKKSPEIITCDMVGWHIIIETEKTSIDEINVFVEGKEIIR